MATAKPVRKVRGETYKDYTAEQLDEIAAIRASVAARLALMPPEVIMRQKLREAQSGDADALRLVAQYVFEKFRVRLYDFYKPLDPAYDREDLDMTFFEAVLRFVPHADGRGDDFYHIGQRGYWAVQSWLRAIKSRSARRSYIGLEIRTPDGEVVDLTEVVEDRCTLDEYEQVDERDQTAQRVRVLSNVTLNTRERQALELIRTGAVGDPRENGFRKDLALAMGISPQRVSQILSGGPSTVGLLEKLETALEA